MWWAQPSTPIATVGPLHIAGSMSRYTGHYGSIIGRFRVKTNQNSSGRHAATITNLRSGGSVQPDRKRKDVAACSSSCQNDETQNEEGEASWQILEDFTREEFAGRAAAKYLSTRDSRQTLKQAFLQAARTPHPSSGWTPVDQRTRPGTDCEASPSQGVILLGILASDVRYAIRSLRDYCNALNIPFVAPVPRGMSPVPKVPAIVGPVYIRYNSSTGQCTITTYSGRDRGVLVQFGSIQVGHFPLGLLDEDMSQPAPPL